MYNIVLALLLKSEGIMSSISNKFSSIIFWDVDPSKIDFTKHRRFIIGRVVQYGTIEDWREVKKLYGIDAIRSEMLQERYLDERSLSFLSCILDVPKEKFRCYIESQSHQLRSSF